MIGGILRRWKTYIAEYRNAFITWERMELYLIYISKVFHRIIVVDIYRAFTVCLACVICLRSTFFKLECGASHLGILLKCSFWFCRSGESLRFCISNKLSNDAGMLGFRPQVA